MSKKYGKYLQFLASDYNILYIGKGSNEVYGEIAEYFASSSKINLSNEMLEKLTSVISKRHINIIVLDVEDNDELTNDFYSVIREYNRDILIVLLFNPKQYTKLYETIPLVDATVCYPYDKELFYKRIFGILSMPYAIKAIGRREILLKIENSTEDLMDEFFDLYEGSSIFISDELLSMAEAIRDGNFSHDFFLHIAEKLHEISGVFSKNDKTQSVSPIFIELAEYLQALKLEEIEPKNLKAFDYLADILYDVSIYLLDMFVDRIFKDIHIFQDSLQSNVEFMKSACEGKIIDSKLDFFHD